MSLRLGRSRCRNARRGAARRTQALWDSPTAPSAGVVSQSGIVDFNGHWWVPAAVAQLSRSRDQVTCVMRRSLPLVLSGNLLGRRNHGRGDKPLAPAGYAGRSVSARSAAWRSSEIQPGVKYSKAASIVSAAPAYSRS
jgi:hypothetical protein